MKKKKVVVGMSGGVDSSVAAWLLKEQGYDVIGVTMQIWQDETNVEQEEHGGCCGLSAVDDARRVAERLEIPYYVMNFKKEFKENVMDYFVQEYLDGHTPNPCIACNRYVKWESLLQRSLEIGADYIATGHYAKMEDGYLKRSHDTNKDQTYFLSQLSHEQLKNVIFPLGDIDKPEVRKIALKYGLKTAKKKDSTGICFIGERNFKNFLKNYLPNQEGDIVDIEKNKVLGKHIGLMYYTIGQRKGLEVGGTKDKLFVVGKNLDKNILYVCEGEDNDYLFSDSCIVENVNFNCDERPTNMTAKFRYRQEDHAINVQYLDDGNLLVKYDSIKSVTPGQACVFYDGDICLGGGIIKEVRKNGKKLWYLL